MPTVAHIMTTGVASVSPEQTLQFAAQLMDRLDVGALPVCTGERLLGMVTDRDITIRGTAAGLGPTHGRVSDVMSRYPSWCLAETDTADVLRRMGEEQIRRLPVVNAVGDLVGIVSLGDLATRQAQSVDKAVRGICEPLAMTLEPAPAFACAVEQGRIQGPRSRSVQALPQQLRATAD